MNRLRQFWHYVTKDWVNNKIKTLTRRAYGDRDEAFFILKLLSLHQAKFKLGG